MGHLEAKIQADRKERTESCIFNEVCTQRNLRGCPEGVCLKYRDLHSIGPKTKAMLRKQGKLIVKQEEMFL